MHSERQPHGTSVSTLPDLGPPQRQKMTSCWPSAPPLLSLPASGRARSGHRGRTPRACQCAAPAPAPRRARRRHHRDPLCCGIRRAALGRGCRGERGVGPGPVARNAGATLGARAPCRPSMAGQPRAPAAAASCAIPSLGSPFGSSVYNAPATGWPPRRRSLGAAEALRPALRGASGGASAASSNQGARRTVHTHFPAPCPPAHHPRRARAAPTLSLGARVGARALARARSDSLAGARRLDGRHRDLFGQDLLGRGQRRDLRVGVAQLVAALRGGRGRAAAGGGVAAGGGAALISSTRTNRTVLALSPA